jgi:hypothetical protein
LQVLLSKILGEIMNNFLLAKYAAKIATIHDKRKELENQIALIYKEARQAGVNRNDLKAAVHRYLAADVGVTEDAVPETEANDSDDLGKHLAIIDRALTKLRERSHD